jgi:PAS domain S-box-containing protein
MLINQPFLRLARRHKTGEPACVEEQDYSALTKEELLARLKKIETERRRSEQDLLSALKELRDVKASLDEHSIVAITDASGRITYVNDKFCAISKYGRLELIGQDHRIINSHYHPKEFFRDLWSTIGRGQVWHGEIKNRAKDGTYYWVDTTIYPFLNDAGKPVQYVAIRTDISRRKMDEANLKQFSQEIGEKNKELETIVYTVSHDLRSPLINVQGFGKHLQRACDKITEAMAKASGGVVAVSEIQAPVSVAIPQALKFINAGISKMDSLLTGLLRYSRIGRIVLTLQRIEMSALMSEIISAMKFQLDEVKAVIVVEPLPDCIGDRAQTGRVLTNLLDNAIKYRSPERLLKLTVSGRIENGDAIYRVMDNGIGISPEHQGKVFEIFHRLDPVSTPGEGLGLAIAQRLLERQGGKIWVENGAGPGSTFLVALPAHEL